mgnify:CR=1 FL=1
MSTNTETKRQCERSGGLIAARFVREVGKAIIAHKKGHDVAARLLAGRDDMLRANPNEPELLRAYDAFCDCITERMDQ